MRRGLVLLAAALLAVQAAAADLTIDLGTPETLTTEELLARPDVATITVPRDVSYKRAMRYRAVPLHALLDGRLPDGDVLQVTATDGFVANLPERLVLPTDGAGSVPWLAIEPPDAPWPAPLPGTITGPFYLVWLDPEASGIRSEQWPYAVASLRGVPADAAQWPEVEVGAEVPAGSPIRHGQLVVVTQCMVCHRMNGAGDAEVGPDLNLPHGPTEYLTPWALRALVRDPGAVRGWPEMRMKGFDAAALSDPDLDAVIAYLGYMAASRP